jgi:signal peptidase I
MMVRRVVAFFLSLFAVGVGQIFLGRTRRGLYWFAFGVLGAPLVALVAPAASRAGFFGVAFAALFVTLLARPLSAVDAVAITPKPDVHPRGLMIGAAFIASLLLVVVSALVTRIFLLEAFKIPSGSMTPTVVVGDHVFVDKKVKTFRRGQLVVFQFPERLDQDFVKRAIAIEGDRIEMRDRHPWINGWEVPHCAVGPASFPKSDEPGDYSGELFVEFLGGEAYLTLVDPNGLDTNRGPWTVPPGEAFVLGDNRDNAHDSRMWNGGLGGTVPRDLIRGEPFIVWLSIKPGGGIDGSRFAHVLERPILPKALSSLEPELAHCLATRPTLAATIPPPR